MKPHARTTAASAPTSGRLSGTDRWGVPGVGEAGWDDLVALGDPGAGLAWVRAAHRRLPGPEAWEGYLARHSRSFHFAARFFPSEARSVVAELYAFCRFTDDLVDGVSTGAALAGGAADDPAVGPGGVATPDPAAGGGAGSRPADSGDDRGGRDARRDRLAAWALLARGAYRGEPTGVPLLEAAVGRAAREGVPDLYARELLLGVAMDLEPRGYPDGEALRLYTWRVASSVGGWLTELFGVRDPAVLRRGFQVGHAMQLTNILRDVGEDLAEGRLYLPEDRMEVHGVSRRALEGAAADPAAPLPGGFPSLMAELAAEARRAYAHGLRGAPALPGFYRRPVQVASAIYAGILDDLERSGWDALRRRARTGPLRKVALAVSTLMPFEGVQFT